MASCCLCQCELSSAQAKKRRKKLHGSSCNESRLLLEKEVEKKFGLGLDAIVETDQDKFEVYHHFSGLYFIEEVNFWRP